MKPRACAKCTASQTRAITSRFHSSRSGARKRFCTVAASSMSWPHSTPSMRFSTMSGSPESDAEMS
jgi:hypothetical protein